MKKIIITSLLALLIASSAFSQEMQNTYKSYNFISPQLESGEFIISFYGSRYARKNDFSTVGTSEISNSNSKQYYGYLDGIIAMTNEILLNFNLTYYPKQMNLTSFSKSTNYESNYEYNENSYFIPTIGMILKPLPNLEIYGNFTFLKSTTTISHSFTSQFSNDISEELNVENYNRLSFGVNYFGKLW